MLQRFLTNPKKWMIIVGVFILFLSMVVHHYKTTQSINTAPISVETISVKEGSISSEAHAVGTLTAEHTVQISPEIAGQVSNILFKDGEFVKQGTPLIQLNDDTLKSKVSAAQAALFYSQTNYERMQILGKKGVVAKQAVDAAYADLKQKQTDANQATVELNKMHLVAPFDGVLSKALVSVGNYVTVGQPIVTLTDIEHLRVEYSVSEEFLPLLKLGQDVSITTSAYPDKHFLGKVAYIAPTINAEDRTISLYASIPNQERLLTSGLYVTIYQSLGNKSHALLVPVDSLVPTIEGQKVYKIKNGKAISIPVTVGQRSEKEVEITTGIQPSDTIITAGQEKLHEGSPVISVNTGKPV